MSFRTTHVGSLPRIPNNNLDELEAMVRLQVEAGLDEVNDGEISRSIYFGNVSSLPGFTQEAYPMLWPSGDVIKTPIVSSPIQWYDPDNPDELGMAGREVQRVKACLDKLQVKRRVKVTIPSMTMMQALYPPQGVPDYTLDNYLSICRQLLTDEALKAFAAGADSVQFDAPTLLAFYGAVDLENGLLDRVKGHGTVEVHACWGNYWNTQMDSETPLRKVLPSLLELHTDVLGPLEVFDGVRDWDSVAALNATAGSFTARLAAGIVSVKSRNVEPVSVLKERWDVLYKAYGDRLIASPGCGFASNPESIHSQQSAKRKLTNMCVAVND